MTQDEIIRMAIKCQLITTNNRDGVYMQALEQFAALVAEATKKECALQTLSDIHQEIEKPQSEPVAWIHRYKTGAEQINTAPPETYVGWTHIPLYTTPPSVEAAIEATKEKAANVLKHYYSFLGEKTKDESELLIAAIRSMK